MIDQASANMLLSAASTIDTVANHFKAAKYQMLSQYSYGVACFVKNEAMELWVNAGKIRKYVIKHEASITDIPAQAAAPVGPADINQCLEELRKKHKQACSVVMDTGKKLKAAGHDTPAAFMFGIYEVMKNDYQEVARYANLTTPGVPGNLLSIDAALYKEYGSKLYKNVEEK